MKKIKYIFAVVAVMAAVSCAKDGELLTIETGSGKVEIETATTDIVLEKANADALALTLNWTDNGTLVLSNPDASVAEGAAVNTIQLSAGEDFAAPVEQIMNKGVYSKGYTVYELNYLLSSLKFAVGVSSPLYIRIKSALGDNIAPTYSNTLTVNVTPYLDMPVGTILGADKADTDFTLVSLNADNVYTGFMGAVAWYNFFLQEPDGTVWGNDDATGTPFMLSSASTSWNFWFPGVTGCYYTVVDTPNKVWSALLIPTLTLSGDVEGEMTFDRKSVTWSYNYTAAATGDITVRIAGTGKQYNVDTGTDDAAALDTAVGFGGTADAVTFGSAATDLKLTVSAAGEVSINLNLSDPMGWTCTVGESVAPPVETPTKLYMPGIDDDINTDKNWTFDNYLTLYDEDKLAYAALCNVGSQWGYEFATEDGNWDDVYKTDVEATAESGTLIAKGPENIPAPTAGLYLIDASLSALTYSTTAVTSVAAAGLNDSWDFVEMTAGATAGTYTVTMNATATTPWGVKVYLNGGWDNFFGGKDGALTFKADGIPVDDSYVGKSVTLTVDLCKCTYTLE